MKQWNNKINETKLKWALWISDRQVSIAENHNRYLHDQSGVWKRRYDLSTSTQSSF